MVHHIRHKKDSNSQKFYFFSKGQKPLQGGRRTDPHPPLEKRALNNGWTVESRCAAMVFIWWVYCRLFCGMQWVSLYRYAFIHSESAKKIFLLNMTILKEMINIMIQIPMIKWAKYYGGKWSTYSCSPPVIHTLAELIFDVAIDITRDNFFILKIYYFDFFTYIKYVCIQGIIYNSFTCYLYNLRLFGNTV